MLNKFYFFFISLVLISGCQTTDTSYKGSFKGGYKDGFGTLIIKNGPNNGDVYEGNFFIGHAHGHGKYTWKNGDVYIGNFKKSLRHGKGIMTYNEEGGKYRGLWENDMRTKGTLFYKNGDKYVGDFKKTTILKENQKHGEGSYYYLDDNQFKGDVYVGRFKNGRKDGVGQYIRSNGQTIKGIFKNDNLIKIIK
jgi:hypothetical protein